MRVVAAGGGTAGHLFPLLAILEELSKSTKLEVLFFSVKGKIDDRLVRQEHPSYEVVPLGIRGLSRPLRRLSNLSRVAGYIKASIEVRREVGRFRPDVAVLTGGYVSAVVGFSLPRSVPVFVQEQNVVPGLANRFLFKRARRVFLSFEESLEYVPESLRWKVEVVGNPVRDRITRKRIVDLNGDFVLVLGGSLGSDLINSTMERVYEMDRSTRYVHSTGDPRWTERLSKFENVQAYDFIDTLPALWRKARAVVARAGATTVWEMIYHGVGGVLIPWSGSAEGHQVENAKAASERLDVLVMREEEVDPERILRFVSKSRRRGGAPLENPASVIAERIMEEVG